MIFRQRNACSLSHLGVVDSGLPARSGTLAWLRATSGSASNWFLPGEPRHPYLASPRAKWFHNWLSPIRYDHDHHVAREVIVSIMIFIDRLESLNRFDWLVQEEVPYQDADSAPAVARKQLPRTAAREYQTQQPQLHQSIRRNYHSCTKVSDATTTAAPGHQKQPTLQIASISIPYHCV